MLGSMLLVSQGCGESGPSLGIITGSVSYRGKPIKSGSLILEVKNSRTAYGTIVDGRITEVTTFKTGDGAPLGLARIAVFATEPEKPSQSDDDANRGYMSGKSIIPPKYNDPSTSGLTHEITSGENVLTLDMK